VQVACGVISRCIEGVEIVVLVFGFWPVGHVKTHALENAD